MNSPAVVFVDDMPDGEQIERAKREAEIKVKGAQVKVAVERLQKMFAGRDERDWKRLGFADRQKYHRLAVAALAVVNVSVE